MKTCKYILIILVLLNISCCVKSQKNEEEQIRETVTKYWKAVKDNNIKECMNLFEDADNYTGVIKSDIYFLHKNYDEINNNNILLKNIEVKDTVVMFTQNRQKYVQYVVKSKNDTNYLKKPLIITFMFYKPIGYDKIFNRAILQNTIDWNK